MRWRMLLPAMTDLDDTALMLRYADGDTGAFETLYGLHRAPLFRFLLRQAGDRQMAEDIFQEVWSRIISNSSNYRPTARFTTYLYHIARNCMIDQYRRAATRPGIRNAEGSQIDQLVSADNPVANAARTEMLSSIEGALLNLTHEQREAFLLKEEGGFTLQEISEITGVGRETVKSRLRYALGNLRKFLTAADEVTLVK
ncbi:MAG: sigma-70 family RNA polymerase sigma factor [Gammaproteobacteria bacterium]|jgi:RNA polymerase sigma factor (sigma-70 family)